MHRLLLVAALPLVASCAAQPPPAPAVAGSADALDEAIARYEPSAEGRSTSALASPAGPRGPLEGTHTIAARDDRQAARARSGRRIDVSLHAAPLDSALTLLANECRLDLVVGGALAKTVSLSLHRIDPCEALDVVASANGVELERRGRVVIARGR